MLRIVLTIIVPLVLPTALYVLWLWLTRRLAGGGLADMAPEPDHGGRRAALPWLWLAGSGAVLLALVLAVVGVHPGTATPGVYVPPRWEDGRIVPGHIEPSRSR